MVQRRLTLYTPHKIQLAFHQSKARYRVAACGRQMGKSTMLLNELVSKAWQTPNTKYWFVSPTYPQAKDQFRKLVGMLSSCFDVISKHNLSELRVKLINQSEIQFKSGEVRENLRGATLHGLVVDEVREIDPTLWPMVLRPMLTTTNGWAAFCSTPAGFNFFYDLFSQARSDQTHTWEAFQAPSVANPLFTREECERAKAEMGEAEFSQEILAEFRDLQSGSAYVNFTEENIKQQCPWMASACHFDPKLPVIVGLDFNLSPMAWSLIQNRGPDFYVFDSLFLKRSHTQEASKELVGRLKALQIQTTPQVILAGDATSKAGQRAAAGQSDYTILCHALDEAGISWTNITPDANPGVKDRVNTVNAKLKAADGSIHLWVHPNCKEVIKDFQRVTWKKGSTQFLLDQTSDPERTHASDGVGYVICALDPLRPNGLVGTLSILRR